MDGYRVAKLGALAGSSLCLFSFSFVIRQSKGVEHMAS